MDHVAILKKEYFDKIISGEKTIESRWSKGKRVPYEKVSVKDTIYLKESGKPVSAKAKADKCLFFKNLDHKKIKQILKKYDKKIGVDMSYFKDVRNKKYCTLVFLKKVEEIPPFDINRDGFNSWVAWLTVKNINEIKIK